MRCSQILFFRLALLFGCALAPILTAVVAEADEKIGTFAIDSLFVRPTYVEDEQAGGHFHINESQFSLLWKKNTYISAYFTVGSELERNLPVYYATLPEDKLGFTSAYAQYKDVYGIFRFGLIPLGFGYDSVVKPSERYFNRSQIFSERIIGLSDYGASFWTENLGYYTQLAVHNGEIDSPSDGRPWVTGIWGYTNDRNLRVQLSVQTGSVKKEVSQGSTNTIGGVVNGETALWRNGDLFVNWYPRGWNFVVASSAGRVRQGEREGRYASQLVELTHFFTRNIGLGARYDLLDPNGRLSGDMQTDTSLLFVMKSDDSSSAFYIVGTKSNEQRGEIPNDQLRVAWLLTPYTR